MWKVSEIGVERADKMKQLKDITVGEGVEGEGNRGETKSRSILKEHLELRDRIRKIEENQSNILDKVSKLYTKQNP